MEENPSWEVNSHSDCQEILHLFSGTRRFISQESIKPCVTSRNKLLFTVRNC